MKITDIIMKVLKVVFSLINSLLALMALFLLYKMLLKIFDNQASIMDVALPLYLFLIFSFNIITNWKSFPIAVSIVQILANLIPVPIIILIIGVALPFALGISGKMIPDIDYHAAAEEVTNFMSYVKYLFIALSMNIALQAFYERKARKN